MVLPSLKLHLLITVCYSLSDYTTQPIFISLLSLFYVYVRGYVSMISSVFETRAEMVTMVMSQLSYAAQA